VAPPNQTLTVRWPDKLAFLADCLPVQSDTLSRQLSVRQFTNVEFRTASPTRLPRTARGCRRHGFALILGVIGSALCRSSQSGQSSGRVESGQEWGVQFVAVRASWFVPGFVPWVAPTVVRSWRCHRADLLRTIVGVRSTGGKHRPSGVSEPLGLRPPTRVRAAPKGEPSE